MRTLLFSALFCWFGLPAVCQQTNTSFPVYSEIEDFMSSPEDYDALMDRMLAGDKTLTIRDYALLYYGFSFFEEYDPEMGLEELNDIRETGQSGEWAEAYKEMVTYLDKIPVTTAGLYTMSYISYYAGKYEEYRKYDNRYKKFADVINKSGKGTLEFPYQAIFQADIWDGLRDIIEEMPDDGILDFKGGLDNFIFRVETEDDAPIIERVYSYDLCRKSTIQVKDSRPDRRNKKN